MKLSFDLRGCELATFCALALLCGLSRPAYAAGVKPPTAILLDAQTDSSDIGSDPNFRNSVVLVLNDLGPDPIGFIINRPTSIPVARLFPQIKPLAQLPARVYFGGPVDFGSVWFLFRAATPPEHAVQACDGVYVSGDRDLLLKLLARAKPMDGLRILVGYAGWTTAQLEAEIAHGFWSVKRADADAIFNGDSEYPWPSSQGPQHPVALPRGRSGQIRAVISQRGAALAGTTSW